MSRRIAVKAPMGPDLATNSHDAGSVAVRSVADTSAERIATDTIFARRQREELAEARRKHPDPVLSLHEGYAILAEEVDELWDLVRQRSHHRSAAAVLEELVQVAAMAQRIAEDLGYAHAAPVGPSRYAIAQQRERDIEWYRNRLDEAQREVTVLAADLRQAKSRGPIQPKPRKVVRR